MLKWITGLFKNKVPDTPSKDHLLTHRYRYPLEFLTDGNVVVYSTPRGIGVQITRARKPNLNGLYLFPHSLDPSEIDMGILFDARVKTLV